MMLIPLWELLLQLLQNVFEMAVVIVDVMVVAGIAVAAAVAFAEMEEITIVAAAAAGLTSDGKILLQLLTASAVPPNATSTSPTATVFAASASRTR